MTFEELPKNKKIVLFDGVCNLCDASIQFIIKYDKKDIFRFVSIQSDLGKTILNHIGLDSSKIDSIILFVPDTDYRIKSQAVFSILKDFDGLFCVFYYFLFLPKFVTNTLYDFVARNRYKWYGKKELCLIFTPELQAKFLF
jgi:predicted DCC family thiol-disulfide oxidoreductase YuxK